MLKMIMLSNDSCYVNNIRSKCFKKGLEVEHFNSTLKFITEIVEDKSGIALIDMRRSSKLMTFFIDEIIKNKILDFKFINMTDFSKGYIDVDNIYSFSATASNVVDVIENISLGKTHLIVNSFSDEDLTKRITTLLDKFCLPITMKGYDYLIEGIKYRVKNFEKKLSINNDLYPYLSTIFNESVANIEKCVRVAVCCIENASSDDYKEFFGDLHVTVKIFIEKVSNYIIKCSYS